MDNKPSSTSSTSTMGNKMMDSNFAAMDPTMATDPRVILNLLSLERATMPQCDYFKHTQRDIQPFMRKVVTTWMLEVGFPERGNLIARV